jgi:hypothetical protein
VTIGLTQSAVVSANALLALRPVGPVTVTVTVVALIAGVFIGMVMIPIELIVILAFTGLHTTDQAFVPMLTAV